MSTLGMLFFPGLFGSFGFSDFLLTPLPRIFLPRFLFFFVSGLSVVRPDLCLASSLLRIEPIMLIWMVSFPHASATA